MARRQRRSALAAAKDTEQQQKLARGCPAAPAELMDTRPAKSTDITPVLGKADNGPTTKKDAPKPE